MFNRIAAAIVVAASFAAVSAEAATVFATEVDVGRSLAGGNVGFEATAQAFANNRNNPGNALGAPDQVGTNGAGFFSLGNGQAAVFGFGTSFGLEATIFEVTFNCSLTNTGECSFRESVDVYAFNGEYDPFDTTFGLSDLLSLGFTFQASVPNGQASTDGGATVAISGPFRYLALVDTSKQAGDGFDIDAVSVSAVPLPASGLFLMGALGGLAFLRRRRAA